MLCYLDKTFCTAVNCSNRTTCHRNLTEQEKKRAISFRLPIAFADFSNGSCPNFKSKEIHNDLHNTN